MGKQVLITGGTGFIGQWIRSTKNEITTSDYSSFLFLNSYEYLALEWENIWSWDYIIHLAPVPIDQVISSAKRCKARVLLASSGGVYDREPDDYFRMKLDDERKLAESGLDYRIARIFTTCGAHMKWERYAIGKFIQQAADGQRLHVHSYGLVVRSYMYGSDLAEWLWKILLDGEPGGVYNVGSDVPHSIAELAFEVASYFGPKPDVYIHPKMQYEPRPFYVPDITRAREELGLSIKVPFEEAVRRTVEDYRNEK